MKLSVALAVYNEEENLARCLNSIKDLAEEIVVVDGGSQDKTVEIAQKFKAKIITTNNPPIFHINKQIALEACQGEWILQLDADEEVTKELAQEIKDIIGQERSAAGFFLKRRNYFLGTWLKKGGQYPDPVIRLIKNGKGKFPCVSVHEQIEVGGEVGWLQNDLLHYAVLNFSKYLINSNRYTTLTAREYAEKKITISHFNIINYLFWQPFITFCNLYFRHKGFTDGFPGLVFALYSGLHLRTSFVKYWEETKQKGS